jgi:hypothetical protein
MKRFQIVGLCLVATFAFSSMVASAAQAASIKACVKVAKVKVEYEKEVPATGTKPAKHLVKSKWIPEGLYSEKNCATLAPSPGVWDKVEPPSKQGVGGGPLSYEGPEGKYEWGPPGVVHFTTKGGALLKEPRLEMHGIGGMDVRCKSSAGTGEWAGPTEGVETVVFKGCIYQAEGNESKEPCTTSGLGSGEITTSKLKLTLISYPDSLDKITWSGPEVLEEPWTPLEGKVYVGYTVEPGHAYAEFECGSVKFRTLDEGPVTLKISSKLNVMGKTMTWFARNAEPISDLYSEDSTDGGSSWELVTGAAYRENTVEAYEPVAKYGGGVEVVEPLA